MKEREREREREREGHISSHYEGARQLLLTPRVETFACFENALLADSKLTENEALHVILENIVQTIHWYMSDTIK
jgi:hypothetical protein